MKLYRRNIAAGGAASLRGNEIMSLRHCYGEILR